MDEQRSTPSGTGRVHWAWWLLVLLALAAGIAAGVHFSQGEPESPFEYDAR